jgi:hypothetical protein
LHLASTIQASPDDSLFVVDANVSPNKANSLITNTLDDQVTIDEDGNAIHHTIIRYIWAINGPVYGSNTYRDYIRVYVPPTSVITMLNGWKLRSTDMAFGHKVLAGFVTFAYGQTRTISLVWIVPRIAKKDGQGWHYQYEVQRQAGALWKLHLEVDPPPCAVVKNTFGGLALSNKKVATLNQTLNEDLLLGADYAC